MKNSLSCFKLYDIRGKLGTEINDDLVYAVGRAIVRHFAANTVAVGCDARLSSGSLKHALISGIVNEGAKAINLGLTGTEEIYFASFCMDIDVGVEITASHNPIDYNGIKLIKRGGVPISAENDLLQIKNIVSDSGLIYRKEVAPSESVNITDSYVSHLLSYIELKNLQKMKIVVDSGNGVAGHVIDKIEEIFDSNNIPVEFIKINHEPDGTFPNGIPNPLIPENREITSRAVTEHKADLGIAWDGDFDRCFLFDENGVFIEGYYIVGLLAEAMLDKNKCGRIIHDPRLVWNTIDIVKRAGGIPVQSKTGHTYIKEAMRKENAVYGGEMSAHHYFRDFAYCDSGMIPWLLVTQLMSRKKMKISQMVAEMIKAYPVSGEINSVVDEPDVKINELYDKYKNDAINVEFTDGLSMEFGNWRFNLRKSNTEPLLRLNVEARNDKSLLSEKTLMLLSEIRG